VGATEQGIFSGVDADATAYATLRSDGVASSEGLAGDKKSKGVSDNNEGSGGSAGSSGGMKSFDPRGYDASVEVFMVLPFVIFRCCGFITSILAQHFLYAIAVSANR
jgi:hypothetical protein